MSEKKKVPEKSRLHPRNINKDAYDLDAMITSLPELKDFVIPNKIGKPTVDFSNPKAVKVLNQGLLKHYYGIENWEFPEDNLCPPVPGRADYIHNIADLLCTSNFGKIPTGNKIKVLDIGVGANCIYPILGTSIYQWDFIGSDISIESIESAEKIVNANPSLQGHVELIHQANKSDFFYGVITKEQKVDITMSNPPFHATPEEAKKGSRRKVKNLTGKNTPQPTLNFAGISNELIYDGGENQFIQQMIRESRKFAHTIFWFTTLVSKQSNLKGIYKTLESLRAAEIKTIPMGTGNKSTRIVAWTFLSKEEQKEWKEERWK